MTEAEISQILQTELAQHRVKVVVKQRQAQLHVLLNRPSGVMVNYPGIARQIRSRLLRLNLEAVTELHFYGREASKEIPSHQYEWQQVFPHTAQDEEASSTTLLMDQNQIAAMLSEVEEAHPEDEIPTELYGNLPVPMMTSDKPGPLTETVELANTAGNRGSQGSSRNKPMGNKPIVWILLALAVIGILGLLWVFLGQ